MKKIAFDEKARQGVLNGVIKLSKAVKSTKGPNGNCVVLQKPTGEFYTTKDGVSVAKDIFLDDEIENAGAQIVKQASLSTNTVVGDGTTTSTILTEAIFKKGLETLNSKKNKVQVADIKRGIEYYSNLLVDALGEIATPIESSEQIAQVGTISANGDTEIGNILAEAFEKVGNDGSVAIEEGNIQETILSIKEGYSFDKGYASNFFITNQERKSVEFKDAVFLLISTEVKTLAPFENLLKQVGASGKNLVIIAKDFSKEVIDLLNMNKARGSLSVCAIKAPEFGDRVADCLSDLAICVGGTVVNETWNAQQMATISVQSLGSCEKLISHKDETIIIGGKCDSEEVLARVEALKVQAESASEFEKTKLEERIARIVGGVAVIYVGGFTDAEVKEKKDRVEDALNATRSAVEEGVVIGGGMALINAEKHVSKSREVYPNKDMMKGAEILKEAIKEPFKTIIANSGKKLKDIGEFETENHGYDARNDKVVNMIEEGILDPKKVTRTALQNAVSVATMLLITEAVIVNDKSKEFHHPPMM